MRLLAAALALLTAAAGPAQAQSPCTRAVASACGTANGTYRVALPETPEGAPAVVFLHGAGGTGAGMLGNSSTVGALTGRGYAVIAPNGQDRPGRNGNFWAFRPDVAGRTAGRDESAFLREVVADVSLRHGIDAERVILAGFSNGAFLVHYLACASPDAFAAYAPVSGGFWRPHPESCAGPVRMLQTHGWQDSTVPLEGRPLQGGEWLQGDIFEGLTIWRAANGCDSPAPSGFRETGEFQRRYWSCTPGSALGLALFPGGHQIPDGWAGMLTDWFEALPARP